MKKNPILIYILLLLISFSKADGCEPGIKLTISDDKECSDKNTAYTNYYEHQLTGDKVKEMDTCRSFDENGQRFDVRMDCNEGSLNLTVRTSDGSSNCQGQLYYSQPYKWGNCYPFFEDQTYYMIVQGANRVRVLGSVLSIVLILSLGY